jgi:hypothetical protein
LELERGRLRPYRSSRKVEWSRERSSRSSVRSEGETRLLLVIDVGVETADSGVEGVNRDPPLRTVPEEDPALAPVLIGVALLLLE